MNTSTQSRSHSRYSGGLIALHWLMLALFIGVYACIELAELFPDHSRSEALLMYWHYQFGLAILLLVWVRLVFRLAGRAPAIEPPLPRWQRHVAIIMHMILYALMILMPISGWLMLSAADEVLHLLGLTLPRLLAPNHQLAELLEEVHEVIGLAGYGLIGLHTLAALLHHYILGDNTLKRMLPVQHERD